MVFEMLWLLNSDFFCLSVKVLDFFHVQRGVVVKKRDVHFGIFLVLHVMIIFFRCFLFLVCIWFSISCFPVLELFFFVL